MISALNYVIKMIKSSQVDSDGSISSWVNEISWNCALQVDEPPVLLRLITTTRCRELEKNSPSKTFAYRSSNGSGFII